MINVENEVYNKKLRHSEELQCVQALFLALYTLALPHSLHAESRIIHVTLFSQQHKSNSVR